MKKYIVFLFSFLAGSYVHAAGLLVRETPIIDFATPVTIAISSTTLTKVPTTQTSGRFGLYINNPSTNSGSISGFLGNCTSTALAITIRPIVFSTNPVQNSVADFFPMREDVCLWLISENTAAATANLHYQEVKK